MPLPLLWEGLEGLRPFGKSPSSAFDLPGLGPCPLERADPVNKTAGRLYPPPPGPHTP